MTTDKPPPFSEQDSPPPLMPPLPPPPPPAPRLYPMTLFATGVCGALLGGLAGFGICAGAFAGAIHNYYTYAFLGWLFNLPMLGAVLGAVGFISLIKREARSVHQQRATEARSQAQSGNRIDSSSHQGSFAIEILSIIIGFLLLFLLFCAGFFFIDRLSFNVLTAFGFAILALVVIASCATWRSVRGRYGASPPVDLEVFESQNPGAHAAPIERDNLGDPSESQETAKE